MPGPCVTTPRLHGHRWRVGVRATSGGALVYQSFKTERQAQEYAVIARDELRRATCPVLEVITLYELHLVQAEQRETSRYAAGHRLRVFFGPVLEQPLGDLTPASCSRLYELACEGRAVDTQRGYLRAAKTFLTWCVKRRLLPSSPAAAVEPVGKMRAGKPQLRIDEARRWVSLAAARAQEGSEGALAALLALLCGLRTTEIVTRTVRDLDDGGRLLVISESKTEAGRRTLELPAPLQPLLRQLAAGRSSSTLLFAHRREWVLDQVHQLCRDAGVPVVSAHGMRGLHATLATRAGASPELVTASIGHEHFDVTRRHYLAPGTVEAAQRDNLIATLAPGFQTGFQGDQSPPGEAPSPSVRGAGLEPACLSALAPKSRLVVGELSAAGGHPSSAWQPPTDPALAEMERILVAALDGLRTNFDAGTLRAQLADALGLLRPQRSALASHLHSEKMKGTP